MCGIFGKLYFKKKKDEKSLLLNCLDKINHRGPDDTGVYQDENIFLGSKRLSIIDRSPQGRMPLSNENNTLWITFNGEIYNYIELKQLLRKKHYFKSHADTEILLHLYEEMGYKSLQYIRGMFAFAIWNTRKRELFVARDRLGKKPLKYYISNDFFIFSSELQALIADPSVPRSVNSLSINKFFSLGYIPSPNTYYKNIYKLEPATFMIVNMKGVLKKERYWKQSFLPKLDYSFEESGVLLLKKLKESIKLRLRSEVPVGIHLSGGIDSSLITAIASQEVNYPLETFSVGFEDNKYNELPYANQISNIYKTNHHEIVVTSQIMSELPDIIAAFGEPFADPSILPTWALSRATKQKISVVLNGDGGDESFGGYRRYRTNILQRYLQLIPAKKIVQYLLLLYKNETLSKINSLIANSNLSPYDFYLNQIFNIEKGVNYIHDTLYKKWDNTLGLVDRLLSFDFKTLLSDCYLVKTDIMSMHFGLETRSPFLDHEIVEFASRLPEKYKFSLFESKILLKSVAKKILPQACVFRPKQGFDVPLHLWFIENKNFIFDTFTMNSDMFMFVSKEKVLKMINDFYHLPNNEYLTKKLWLLLVFHIWSLSAIKSK